MKRIDPHRHHVIRAGSTFIVPNVATVESFPHRRPQEARQLAQRIAREPRAYLAVVRITGVPGVRDDRYGPSATPALAG